jgi:hypothetical protein
MILWAVFASALTSLLFEILLTRVFAITQWHHMAFVAISVAMLGTAASGVLLNLRRRTPTVTGLVGNALVLLSIATAVALLVLRLLPVDVHLLFVDLRHALRLALWMLFLSVPFFFSGLLAASAYAMLSERSGLVHLAALAGSGCGIFLAPLLLVLLGLEGALLVAVVLPAGVALFFAGIPRRGAVLLLLVACGAALLAPGWLVFQPGQYKTYSHYMRYPEFEHRGRLDRPEARYDRVASPYIRFSPGLSLSYRGELPAQEAIMTDGDLAFVLFDVSSRRPSFASRTLISAAYRVMPAAGRVLIIQNGGGLAVPAALAAGATRTEVLLRHRYGARAFAGAYSAAGVEVIHRGFRSHLERSASLYDLVFLEDWGPSDPGLASLSSQPTLTVEAVGSMLRALRPQGYLVLTRRLHMPPNDFERMLRTCRQALGVAEAAADQVAVLRSWDAVTILLSPEPLAPRAIEALRGFAGEMSFDLCWYPGVAPEEVNRYNILEEPFYYGTALAVLSDGEPDRGSLFDTRPATDDRPYPYAFVPLQNLGRLAGLLTERLYALALTGEAMLALLFATALILSLATLGLPLLLAGRGHHVMVPGFAALGAGFMFAELGWLGMLTTALGDATPAFMTAVGGLLLFAGLGGAFSPGYPRRGAVREGQRADSDLSGKRGRRRFGGSSGGWFGSSSPPIWALALLAVALTGAAQSPLMSVLVSLPSAAKVAVALTAIAPLGFALGIPFPLAVRLLLGDRRERAYAWAVNGASSVLGAVLATQLSLSFGHRALFLLAALCYAVVWIAFGRRMR